MSRSPRALGPAPPTLRTTTTDSDSALPDAGVGQSVFQCPTVYPVNDPRSLS